MTPAEVQSLYIALLQALRAQGEVGMPADRLLNGVRIAGFTTDLPTLNSHLRMLCDRSWVAGWESGLGGRRYRITGLGESQLTEAGL
ncbi:hypothetical protein [Actomonas aquatica]|uniref:Uncharacterized protein n=1 Tax=Actomonas aquatica TaxID=2866162 RepID=A0ABZ1CCL1_9BACT|nr:hypothetical protein [Opitutus sp. WL0086]WRQ89396.1 hypothetical protein K1X11_008240 [Opitutus sp. WL0086]